MAAMTLARLMLPLMAAGIVAMACGGGGDDGAGKGQRVNDPARVATSTPIQNATRFHIQGDVVSTSGGSGALTPISGVSTPSTGVRTYTVKPGDTCSAIATQANVTLDELKRANRTINDACSNLNIGDILRLPGPATVTPVSGATGSTPRPGSGRTYTVQSGDTCDAIAKNQGVTVAAIIAANGLDQNCSLKVGQVVKIP